MHIEDEIVRLYFFHVSPDMILRGQIPYDNFPKKEFSELLFCYQKEYTETENQLIYQNMKNYSKHSPTNIESNLNVFYALEHTASEILEFCDNDIRCKYEQIQRWREMARDIGEDLLVCAFFSEQYREQQVEYDWFNWDIVLGHTNSHLNAIMRRGITDNHFHLFGSAPVFHLIWIKLMNNVNMSHYVDALQGIEDSRRTYHYHFDQKYRENSMNCRILQAALMRMAMFCYLNMESGEEESEDIKIIVRLLEYLKKGECIQDVQSDIRTMINLLKARTMYEFGEDIPDYALDGKGRGNLNWIFSGERQLVYRMLCEIQVNRELPDKIRNLLYPYLVIRNTLRGEIIQNNENIGFENFSVYSKRKKGLLVSNMDNKRMIWYAVRGSFKAKNLRMLEIRISPRNNYLDNARQIQYYDSIITGQNYRFSQEDKIDKEQFFYVYHFSKEADKEQLDNISTPLITCRHSRLRRKIQTRGNAIIQLRNHMPVEASRIFGIDACAQEIGCRPEVFAPVFRKLRNHVILDAEESMVKQLKVTFHVGEDFLDMVDGLRAVDEAVHFLDMQSGDRLGHATVLGLSVENWYTTKNNTILVSEQDYLDNVVWLYYKLLEFQITDCEILKSFLVDEYKWYFYRIYEKNLGSFISSDIFAYYSAWKLRGDLPEYYRNCDQMQYTFDIFGSDFLYETFPENEQNRYKEDVARLYWAYHYSKEVRIDGKHPIQKEIPQMYVDGVKQVQMAMRRMIAKKGICIETNPSSNLAISTMKRYEDHPIFNLYNMGLNQQGQGKSPQLFVSINTDDKGVFRTSLENEYALLAATLEFMKDEYGENTYTPIEVYEWLEKIRRMGNEQSFKS